MTAQPFPFDAPRPGAPVQATQAVPSEAVPAEVAVAPAQAPEVVDTTTEKKTRKRADKTEKAQKALETATKRRDSLKKRYDDAVKSQEPLKQRLDEAEAEVAHLATSPHLPKPELELQADGSAEGDISEVAEETAQA